MITDYTLRQSLEDLFKYANEDSEISIDLGLNKWGQGKLGLLVEMYLRKEGCRALTDKEIMSWRTIGDILATIREARKARGRGPKRKLPVAM